MLDYVAGQLDKAGAIASDTVLLVEVFDDALGDPRMVLHSPFGGRVNGPWGLALASALRERTGARVEVQTNDDGILLRFPDSDAEFPLDLVSSLGPARSAQAYPRRAAGVGGLRSAVPPERLARPAAPRTARGQADTVLAAAAEGEGPSAGRFAPYRISRFWPRPTATASRT